MTVSIIIMQIHLSLQRLFSFVIGQSVQNINAQLSPGGRITGTIVLLGGGYSNYYLSPQIFIKSDPGKLTPLNYGVPFIYDAVSGKYEIYGLATGTYRVGMVAGMDGLVSSWYRPQMALQIHLTMQLTS